MRLQRRRARPEDACRYGLTYLATRAGRGDQAAFGELVDAAALVVLSTVVDSDIPDGDRDEVVVAGLCLMWRRAPRFDPSRESVVSWVRDCALEAAGEYRAGSLDHGRRWQTI
ncbi:MAG: hypothetical protein ACRDV1_06660 [Actinomycetes bacterium]